MLRMAYRLATRTGVCVDEPEKLLKAMSIQTVNRHRAFAILEPYGYEIENRRHIDSAILARAKSPRMFGYRKPGPMTAAEITQANRDAGNK